MKLNYKKTFLVGFAFFIVTLFWTTYDTIVAKILIDKFGLNQTWSGLVMAMDNILALFLIPLFGSLSDKTKSKRGRRTPYIIIGTILASLLFMGLTYSDNRQTTMLETETNITEQYAEFQETELDYNAWVLIQNEIVVQWDELLADGVIDQGQYDTFYYEVIDGDDTDDRANWEDDQREGIAEILAYEGTDLDNNTLNDLKECFYHHLNQMAWIQTSHEPTVFIIFVINLLFALFAMASFRSPAVALMPDVTNKPLRSRGNAVINLMGTFGGMIAIGLLMVFGLDNLSYVNYAPAFLSIGVLMVVVLIIFLLTVNEPKLVAEKEALDKEYGISDDEEDEDEEIEEGQELSKGQRKSLLLILLSVLLWFTAYNAVTTKLSDYAPKVLELGFSMPLLIAQGVALISFIPIGIIATKLGRRRTIIIGIIMLTACFGSIYFLKPGSSGLMYVIFALTGVAWATINVNSYPMVVELSKGSNVGKYTGYYYTFSMAAQILTPILSGFLMDQLGRTILFPYAAFFAFASLVTMLFVRHGDAKVVKKDSILENFDVDMD